MTLERAVEILDQEKHEGRTGWEVSYSEYSDAVRGANTPDMAIDTPLYLPIPERMAIEIAERYERERQA